MDTKQAPTALETAAGMSEALRAAAVDAAEDPRGLCMDPNQRTIQALERRGIVSVTCHGPHHSERVAVTAFGREVGAVISANGGPFGFKAR